MHKNILLISPQPYFQWRGTPIRVHYNVQALAELGFTVDLLTLPIGEKINPKGANVIRVANPLRKKQIPIGPSFYKLFFDFLILIKGFQLIRRKKYAIIHGIEEGGIIGAILSKRAGSKSIFEKHSDPVSHKKGLVKNALLLVYAAVERLNVKYVQAVICTGSGLAEQVKKMGKDTAIFNISDVPSSRKEPSGEEVIQMRIKLQKYKDEILITYVGSFAPYQGIDLLMRTITEVMKGLHKVRFIIIGGKDAEIENRISTFRNQGVPDSITFMGMVAPDKIPVILSASDILISPRTSGVNTPLKVLDYLKAGKPVVATNVEANSLILNDNMAVFSEPNPKSMATAIISLVENPEKRKLMGLEGRELYETKYNFQSFSNSLNACYKYVLNLPS